MRHREITADVIREVDCLLAQGMDHVAISEQLEVTAYVIGVVANDKLGRGRSPRPDRYSYHTRNCHRGFDAATIRMIERMLQVGMLNQRHIAREVGVSRRIVDEVAAGKRLPVSTERPFAFEDLGERLLVKPRRCWGCGAMLAIVPCRYCRARRERLIPSVACLC
jgi:hypothetical protein